GFEWHYLHRLHRNLLTVPCPGQDLLAVAFSPDGKRAATVGFERKHPGDFGEGKVTVRDTTTGQELLTLTEPRQVLDAIAFSPDGRRLAVGSSESVKVWEAGQEVFTVKDQKGGVHSVAFSPDGRFLATGDSKGTVKVRDAATGQALRAFT